MLSVDLIDFTEEDKCPVCGSYNAKTNKVYENSDADGRRGRWVRYIECKDCGEEI